MHGPPIARRKSSLSFLLSPPNSSRDPKSRATPSITADARAPRRPHAPSSLAPTRHSLCSRICQQVSAQNRPAPSWDRVAVVVSLPLSPAWATRSPVSPNARASAGAVPPSRAPRVLGRWRGACAFAFARGGGPVTAERRGRGLLASVRATEPGTRQLPIEIENTASPQRSIPSMTRSSITWNACP